jgi:hypothetical protein
MSPRRQWQMDFIWHGLAARVVLSTVTITFASAALSRVANDSLP